MPVNTVEKNRARVAAWYQNNKERKAAANRDYRAIVGGVVQGVKEEAVCAQCGDARRPLECDHVSEYGEKCFDVADGTQKGLGAVLAELEKCQQVCHSCHGFRTILRLLDGTPPDFDGEG